jgi:hypothetical protein
VPRREQTRGIRIRSTLAEEIEELSKLYGAGASMSSLAEEMLLEFVRLCKTPAEDRRVPSLVCSMDERRKGPHAQFSSVQKIANEILDAGIEFAKKKADRGG